MSIYYVVTFVAIFGILWGVGLALLRVFTPQKDRAAGTGVHASFSLVMFAIGASVLLVALFVFDFPVFDSSGPRPFSSVETSPPGLILALTGLVVAGFAAFLFSRPRQTLQFSSYLVVFVAGKIGDALSADLAPSLKASFEWGYIQVMNFL